MRRDRDHHHVKALAQEKAISYDEAEDLTRYQAQRGCALSGQVVKEIDSLRESNRTEATLLNKSMAAKLGTDTDGAAKLIAAIAADSTLESWLARRVNLTRADGRVPPHDSHHENQ